MSQLYSLHNSAFATHAMCGV